MVRRWREGGGVRVVVAICKGWTRYTKATCINVCGDWPGRHRQQQGQVKTQRCNKQQTIIKAKVQQTTENYQGKGATNNRQPPMLLTKTQNRQLSTDPGGAHEDSCCLVVSMQTVVAYRPWRCPCRQLLYTDPGGVHAVSCCIQTLEVSMQTVVVYRPWWCPCRQLSTDPGGVHADSCCLQTLVMSM